MDGEAYLRRLITSFLHDLKEPIGDPGTRSMVSGWKLGEAEAAGFALVAAGVLDQARCREILSEFKTLLIDRGVIQEWSGGVSFELGAVAENVGGEVERKEPPDEWKKAFDPDDSPDLQRVIPIVKEVGVKETGQRVILISLEVWVDRFTLRCATDRSTPPGETTRSRASGRPQFGRFAWEITDDVGTRYRQGGGGGGGARPWYLWAHHFYPSLATEANRLEVAAHDFETVEELFRVTVDLD
jgi:hypothetical protein